MSEQNLQFPIGPYIVPEPINSKHHQDWVQRIASLPERLETLVKPLSTTQLATPYRPGGWTVQQLIHHIADSHMNAYIRFKLGMTEEEPTIKPYDQDAWSNLPDNKLPIEVSMTLIQGIHLRWTHCLEGFRDWQRKVYHPEQATTISLEVLAGMYAWHGDHHLAHIQNLISRKGW